MWKMLVTCWLVLPFSVSAAETLFAHDEAAIVQGLQAPLKARGARGPGGIAQDPPKVAALIEFDVDSATIRADSRQILAAYGRVLKNQLSDAVIVIAGHTDSDADEDYNLALSQRRATAVKRFLVDGFAIAAPRLRVEAYGESQPIDDNAIPEGKARNRRVEFIRVGRVD